MGTTETKAQQKHFNLLSIALLSLSVCALTKVKFHSEYKVSFVFGQSERALFDEKQQKYV